MFQRGSKLPALQERETVLAPEEVLVWIHAPKAGSVQALAVAQALLDADPELPVLLTHPDGVVDDDSNADVLRLDTPLTSPQALRGFLRDWDPPIALIYAELADPDLILRLRQGGANVTIYAAPSRAAPLGFDGLGRIVLRGLLRQVNKVFAVSDQQLQELATAGLPANAGLVTGPLPNRPAPAAVDAMASQTLASQLAGRPSWLAKDLSVAEEDLILTAYERTAQKAHRSLLVVEQPDPARAAAFVETAKAQGRHIIRRSEGSRIHAETQIVVADLPDEFPIWMRIVPLIFLGETLNGLGATSDPFEPAALGAAILHGPRFGRHHDDYLKLDRAGAARVVRDLDQLSRVLIELQAADKVAQMAHAAWDLATKSAEATALVSDAILTEVATRKAS